MGSPRIGYSWATFTFTSVVKNLPANAGDIRDLGDPIYGQGRSPGGGHSCALAWRIPWTEEPGRLQSIGLQRVGHNWSELAHTHMLIVTHPQAKWHIHRQNDSSKASHRGHSQLNGQEFEQTPGDSEGQGSLACCSLWGPKELVMTEWLNNNNIW